MEIANKYMDMLENLQKAMVENDMEQVEELNSRKEKLSLANNAYAVMPFDKSHLPRDEVAEMILPENDLDVKGLKALRTVCSTVYKYHDQT